MDTIIRKITDDDDNNEIIIKTAADIIAGGGLVAFPTETVYGLGGMHLMLMHLPGYMKRRAGLLIIH